MDILGEEVMVDWYNQVREMDDSTYLFRDRLIESDTILELFLCGHISVRGGW